jgi:hypothetical protein
MAGGDPESGGKLCAFDFGKPVIDFYVRAEDGVIWVSVDAEWSGVGRGEDCGDSNSVRVVRLCDGEVGVFADCFYLVADSFLCHGAACRISGLCAGFACGIEYNMFDPG